MTRIIAGRAGSIGLDVPSAGTRPTSARVRESLFAVLESADVLTGASVLDLYAGSGALGLEAASRGAASVDFVEGNARAAGVARRNAARVGRAIGDGVPLRVHRSSVLAFLQSAAGPYDLVMIDPPYDLPARELAAALALLPARLADGATVVLEQATRAGDPPAIAELDAVDRRRYGDTTLWWLAPA